MIEPEALHHWTAIRRYAVPGWMIDRATDAREAGDWRAACAAARIDVDVDLDDVDARWGPAAREQIRADLAGFAPDLLRWHLPRGLLFAPTVIVPALTLVLTTAAGRLDPSDPALLVRTAPWNRAQRLRLSVGPAAMHGPGIYPDRPRVDVPPERWHAAHAHRLAASYGGGGARPPGFDPDGTVRPESAWATGPQLDPDDADPATRAEAVARRMRRGDTRGALAIAGITVPADQLRPTDVWDVNAVGARYELDRLSERWGHSAMFVPGWFRADVNVLRRPDGGPLSLTQVDGAAPSAAMLPGIHTALPDLELLRDGRIRVTDLHPLVRAALFPEVVDPAPPAYATNVPDLTVPLPVSCAGAEHHLVHAGGRLRAVFHDDPDTTREAALRALGAAVPACHQAIFNWRGQGVAGDRPPALGRLVEEVVERLTHGGSTTLALMLDAGLDPFMRDRQGRGLIHHLRWVDAFDALPRLLAAGLDIDARDLDGTPALTDAVRWWGTPALVRALLDAGADPGAATPSGQSARSYLDGERMGGPQQRPLDEDAEIRAMIRAWTPP